ncbi:MAG: hypothetical protein M0D57_10570 [Sphingobacteriales bacterium JAD_PAG50586_3]|nr:MAG: hypothetical protein M0D57_10570 [Sphingobacteriales bacterium JAD_PAG50586_3]
MTYKDKFRQSENRAHSKIIATKIIRDMNELRASVESSSTAPRRWVWELIQNAKDVHSEDGVKIKIKYRPNVTNPYIKFIHTGEPFSADNIRYLIEQISSKDRDNDEDGKRKNTGKFGTGFLATHLLSEVVTVEGVAKEPELDFHKFKLVLDRSGYELDEITDAVQNSKEYIEDLDDSEVYVNYEKGAFNTSFRYPLTDNVSLKVAELGLADLQECLPYTLAFVNDITSLEIEHEGRKFFNTRKAVDLSDNIQLITIRNESIENPEDYQLFRLILLSKGFTFIAIPVKK